MGKSVNLNSAEWRDIIFENRNKAYGAYNLRATSSKRFVVAFIAMLVVVVAVVALPSFIEAVKPNKTQVANIDESFELSQLDDLEEQVQEEDIIRQETAPPPPPLKATIQFTPPVITEDSKVDEEKEMKSMEELNESKVQISIANVEGSDDKNAVDIAELKEHKVIVEEKEPERPFESVEQMPQFPGGDAELLKYVSSNLRYPTIAAENGIEGLVVVRFVVNKDGVVSDAQILRSLDPSCDREALRVVKSMPKWVPGKQNGRNVAVYYTLPVRFQLQK